MRMDYFTLSELGAVMGVHYQVLRRRFDDSRAFVAHKVGGARNGKWIIHKKAFFDWYDEARRTGVLCELFPFITIDHESIERARIEYKVFQREDHAARARESIRKKARAYNGKQ